MKFVCVIGVMRFIARAVMKWISAKIVARLSVVVVALFVAVNFVGVACVKTVQLHVDGT